MVKIRQRFEAPLVADLQYEIFSGINRLDLASQQVAGRSVAVACSSRGIADYDAVVESTISGLKGFGLKPFIVPAMGSHGGGTAEGQKKALVDAGITPERMGVAVMSSLETVEVGLTADGIPVLIDRFASEADFLVPINRIRSHTMFTGEIESGLMKMLAVGLGKPKGAAICHEAAFAFGLEHVIRTVARTVMAAKKVLFGIGVIENAYCRPAGIGVFRSDELEEREKRYLVESKRLEPRLPFESIDVLIVDIMGKDISGAGMDCNVIGRIGMPLMTEDPPSPRIKRIVVCDLTEKSEGNAIGIGLADITTRRLVEKIDPNAMYANAAAASDPEHVKIPMTMPNERQAIDAAVSSIGAVDEEALKIVRIKSTKHLDEMIVSEPCLAALANNPMITVISEPFRLAFDADGRMEVFEAK
jgi:hypothetical protein